VVIAVIKVNFSPEHRWKDLRQIRVEVINPPKDAPALFIVRKRKPCKGWYVEKRTSQIKYCMGEYGTECYRDFKHEIVSGGEHFDRLDHAKKFVRESIDRIISLYKGGE